MTIGRANGAKMKRVRRKSSRKRKGRGRKIWRKETLSLKGQEIEKKVRIVEERKFNKVLFTISFCEYDMMINRAI